LNSVAAPRIAPVAPVPPGTQRPRWSVMIPTYKSTRHLRVALESVLAQAPAAAQMQIEVVDDGSPEPGAQQLVAQAAGERVAFFRKPRNAGLVANFNTCIERARGELVHILHDDDAVLPGFYGAMEEALARDETLGAAFSRYVGIDDHDRWTYVSPLMFPTSRTIGNPALQLGRRNLMRTPSVVVRRAVYERIGGFDARVSHTADWEMWVRIAAHYGIWYEERPLALYREHAGSDTTNLVRSGENLRQIRKAIDLIREHIPVELRPGCRGLGHAWAVLVGWYACKTLLRKGELAAAARVLGETLRCLPRPDEALRGLRMELDMRRAAQLETRNFTHASG
jgi:glycosyltransferase involved in cell wall biosynthesis